LKSSDQHEKEALEGEISRWSGFVRALRKPEREVFEELIAVFRSHAFECSKAPYPLKFESMVFSIFLFQQKRINQLEKNLQTLKPEKLKTFTIQEDTEAKQVSTKT